jgi:general secretion pathway protein C
MAISLDAAKRLAAWKDQPPEQWLKLVNRYLPPAVTAVLVLAIAYRLAELTWLLVPSTPPHSPPPPVAAPRTAAAAPAGTTYDLEGWHPFGEASAGAPPPVVATQDAPETTLALVLASVHAFPEPTDGYAGIASGSGCRAAVACEQKLYHTGAAIDGANGATLHSVYADRVLIDRGGRVETLRFPEPQQLPGGPLPPTARLAPPPQPAQNANLREVISANASRITDIIRAVPHIEGDQMVGYRVTPARNREAFGALGLEPGDVLTEVNGTALNDPASSLQVFESLGEASMATVTVLRNGTSQAVVIDMTQIQNIAENLQ